MHSSDDRNEDSNAHSSKENRKGKARMASKKDEQDAKGKPDNVSFKRAVLSAVNANTRLLSKLITYGSNE